MLIRHPHRLLPRPPGPRGALASGIYALLLLAALPAQARRLAYTIEPGDTLSELAQRFEVRVGSIRAWNKTYFERHKVLKIGRRIFLNVAADKARAYREEQPQTKARTFRYAVLPGDTLWHIARRFKVTTAAIRAWNPRVDPRELRPGTRLVIRSRAPRRGQRKRCVRLERGDSLWRVARKLKVTVSVLKQTNRIRDNRALKVGRLICAVKNLPAEDSRAIGKPQSGHLVAGEQLQDGPGFHVKRPRAAWGTNELISMIYDCVGKVRRRFRGRGAQLVVGDLSFKTGGSIGGHVSHQNGTDVDLGFYYTKQAHAPRGRFITRPKQIDAPRTFALLRCLIDTGDVQYVFMDRRIQRKLYRYARAKRLYPRADLNLIFEYGPPRGGRRRSTIVLHEPNHADHMHVRIFCPPGDVRRGKGGRCVPSPGRHRPVSD